MNWITDAPRRILTRILKNASRALVKSPIHRRNVLRKQTQFLDNTGQPTSKRTIVFLVPDTDIVNGGILSITSLADETERLAHLHGADVYVSPYPGGLPLLRFTQFENTRTLVDLKLLLSRLPSGNREVLIHIPEHYLACFLSHNTTFLKACKEITFRFNLMLQNIDLLPTKEDAEKLKRLGSTTCTTAHQSYCNNETEAHLGCPVIHFSVWVSPEQYERVPYEEKRNLIVVSPDHHPNKKQILDLLCNELPNYEFQIINNLTYEAYKQLISEAKFSLTFGEGLDGYFAETIFSGGIGCAVYNDRFFTPDFEDIPFVDSSWDSLMEGLATAIRRVDDSNTFGPPHSTQFECLADQYSFDRYQANLASFYERYFPCPTGPAN